MSRYIRRGLYDGYLDQRIRKKVRLRPIAMLVIRMIAVIDTVIHPLRVLCRRASMLGPAKLFSKKRISNDIPILYFDMGTHEAAKELDVMVNNILPSICQNFRAYGFEASLGLFEKAKEKFAGRTNIDFVNAAVGYMIPKDGKIRLFIDPVDGQGNSIYRANYTEYEEVEAIRFSDWLCQENIDLKNSICILRMNIEGAEYDVIMDLIDSGLVKYIDGYYGSWDDVAKIDKERDDEFQVLLEENHISPLCFDERDYKLSLRMIRARCIQYDIRTSILKGMRRIKRV